VNHGNGLNTSLPKELKVLFANQVTVKNRTARIPVVACNLIEPTTRVQFLDEEEPRGVSFFDDEL
jgi:hypothetical protein